MPHSTENNDTSDCESYYAMIEEEQKEKRENMMAKVKDQMLKLEYILDLDNIDSSDTENELKLRKMWKKFCDAINKYVSEKQFYDE